jgi:hypothetical protein
MATLKARERTAVRKSMEKNAPGVIKGGMLDGVKRKMDLSKICPALSRVE